MALWSRIRHGVRGLLRREELDAEIAEEVRHFLDEAEADLVESGLTPAEASRRVRLERGDPLAAREDVVQYGWESWLADLWSDTRLAARRLRRTPGFTGVAVLTLGLGIGASTAIFSVVNPVLFRPLDYPEADRIVSIADLNAEGVALPVTFGTFREVAARSRAFEGLAVFKPFQPTLTGGAEPERLEGQRVSADYFDVLRIQPAVGRGFESVDDRPGGANVVLLSDQLWQSRFSADPAIVGDVVELNSVPYTVLGVMPASFENATADQAQLWALMQYEPELQPFDTREWGHHLGMIGRVGPSVDPEGALDALAEIARAPVAEFPRPDWANMQAGFDVRRLKDAATASARPTMLVLLGSVLLLLVIACANVTILLLARGARRRGELSMRVALGAGRGRLIRQLLTESLLLAAIGGAFGLFLARLGTSSLVAVSPSSLPRLASVGLDPTALLFALGLTTAVGVMVGLAPAFSRSGGALTQQGGLGAGVRLAGRGFAGRDSRARRGLVATEVALALVLLVGAGLLIRSTQRLFSEPTGFDASRLVVMQVSATGLERGDAPPHQFFDQALEAVRSVPGVRAAAMTAQLPLSGDVDSYGLMVDGSRAAEGITAAPYRYAVSPGYLDVLGIPLLRGRTLLPSDGAGSPKVAVLSETLANQLFPGEDPLGRRVRLGDPTLDPFTIVGVVGDVKQESLELDAANAVYMPAQQWHWADRVRWIVVKAAADPLAVVPAVRQAVWSIDRNQPILRAQTMESIVAHSEAQRRFVMMVLIAFALLALVLAGVGLYGVMAGTVSDRMPEIGIRAAVGASQESLLRMILWQGMTWVGVGMALGLLVAAAASELLVTLLFGVSRLDPMTYLVVVGVLILVATVACWIPGLRAARVDPLKVLG